MLKYFIHTKCNLLLLSLKWFLGGNLKYHKYKQFKCNNFLKYFENLLSLWDVSIFISLTILDCFLTRYPDRQTYFHNAKFNIISFCLCQAVYSNTIIGTPHRYMSLHYST